MSNDLIFGTRRLAKGRIRRVAQPLGRRVECVSGVLWVTQDGDPRDIVLEPGRGVRLRSADGALISALDDSRYLLLDGCARSASLNRALQRVGKRQRHDLDALLAQRLGVLARGPAADAALLDLAVVDAAGLLGEALADVLGRGHARGARRAATATAASSPCSASVPRRPPGAACRPTLRCGALGRRMISVSPHSGQATPEPRRLRREVLFRSEPAFEAVMLAAAQVQDLHGRHYPHRPVKARLPLRAASGRRASSAARAGRSGSWHRSARPSRAAASSSSTLASKHVEELAGVELALAARRGRARTRPRCPRGVGDGVVRERRRAPIRRRGSRFPRAARARRRPSPARPPRACRRETRASPCRIG